MESFQFTLSNGTVTGISETFGTHSRTLTLPTNATFVVGATTITETLTGTDATRTVVFTQDPANAANYDITSSSITVTTPTTSYGNSQTAGFGFTVANGAVTAESFTRTWNGNTHTDTLHLSPTATFSVDATSGAITEVQLRGSAIDTTTFVQPTGSTLYAVASETTTYIQPGSATTLLSVEPNDRAMFTISGGAVTGATAVHPDGTTSPVTLGSSTTLTQLATGFVEAATTHNGHSFYEVFYDSSGSGTYMEVAHGTGTTVDLVGLQAQIAQLPSAIAALI